MFTLREYQQEAVDSVFTHRFGPGANNIVLVLPTGTGKSLVIAEIVRHALMQWPFQRFLMVTHISELVQQNHEKLVYHWPNAPVGIHSAELGKRDVNEPIIFGNVQSMLKNVAAFGHRDVVIVDECHAIGPKDESNYGKFFAALKAINPNMIVIGLTATPFRMGMGLVTDGPMFDLVRYDLSGIESFNRLVKAGYLSPLITKPTEATIDTAGVAVRAGEFSNKQLQEAADRDEITFEAMGELTDHGTQTNRQSWIVFTSGVHHAETAAQMLRQNGVAAQTVHSKIGKEERRQRILGYKSGAIQCLVTNNMLTTGFDHPETDLIGALRPTMSPGLWVQMLGRGTRVAENKNNCLVMDFARNTPRLGPINDPKIPNPKGKKTGDIPMKVCPNCEIYNFAGARFCGGGSNPDDGIACGGCGFEFVFETKYYGTSGTEAVMVTEEKPKEKKIKDFKVERIWYSRKEKGSSVTMEVQYVSGLKSFREWVPFEHGGVARQRACEWWNMRHADDVPLTVHEALSKKDGLVSPKSITVDMTEKYPQIIDYRF